MKRVRVQQGMSLIEVLLAVALLATVVVVGAQALLVTVTGSDQLARESRTQLALTNFAETLRALPYRRPCAVDGVPGGTQLWNVYTSDFRAAVVTAGLGWKDPASGSFSEIPATLFSVVNVRYWNAVTNSWDSTPRCSSSLDVGAPYVRDQGAELLIIRVSWGSKPGQAGTAEIVKRRQ